MAEIIIKSISVEELKEKNQSDNLNNLKNYKLEDMAMLMAKREVGEIFYLVDNKLYEDPEKYRDFDKSLSEEQIKHLESLHDKFRDSLIELREYLYHRNGEADSEEATALEETMKKAVIEAKDLLDDKHINNIDELKSSYSKFLIPDFTNKLFDINLYYDENEIDCGL